MLQADSLLMDSSYVEVIESKGGWADFPGEIGVSRQTTDTLGQAIAAALERCQLQEKRQLSAWILTDVDVEYKVTAKADGKLSISGNPYYYIWGPGLASEDEVEELPACTRALREKATDFALRAPRVWGAVMHFSKLSALLRGIEEHNPAAFESIPQRRLVVPFYTPRAWPRQRYEPL